MAPTATAGQAGLILSEQKQTNEHLASIDARLGGIEDKLDSMEITLAGVADALQDEEGAYLPRLIAKAADTNRLLERLIEAVESR
jgi:archaellum component FlaC